MKRNAPSDAPTWAALAYMLWRRGHRTPVQIAEHLRGEGWAVTPLDVESVVMQRVGEDLARHFGGRRR